MSIRIILDNQPEFYTNLDLVTGRVALALHRAEQVGSIVVKLEGEAVTALRLPERYPGDTYGPRHGSSPDVVSENHKILYKVQQVFPDEYHASTSSPYGAFPLQPGEHEFPFRFKLPLNNACSDAAAMARIGGFGSGGGLFGMGGVRVMDGSKQLFLHHVTRTLPPSLTGYPMEAEIRYYIKATVQRPGLLKENWRYQVGFKFLPIEPPRHALSGQEAFARRPFAFRARSPPQPARKRSTLFAKKLTDASSPSSSPSSSSSSSPADAPAGAAPPSIEISARLPHPPILTCNQPVPLRLIAKKLADCREQVYLVSFQMDLVGITQVRSHDVFNTKMNRWVVASATDLAVPVTASPDDATGAELVLPSELWRSRPLPNTVAPSFVTCNLQRKYALELKIGLSWGKPRSAMLGKADQPQAIFLPLQFADVHVYSGVTPPLELVQAAANAKPRPAAALPPRLPPRASGSGSGPGPPSHTAAANGAVPPPMAPHPAQDPLYPPQLAPGQTVPPYDDAPPSYDEAMAENLSGPFDGARPRPAYSGVTNENGPSQVPQKS